jgi:hypothetical protein
MDKSINQRRAGGYGIISLYKTAMGDVLKFHPRESVEPAELPRPEQAAQRAAAEKGVAQKETAHRLERPDRTAIENAIRAEFPGLKTDRFWTMWALLPSLEIKAGEKARKVEILRSIDLTADESITAWINESDIQDWEARPLEYHAMAMRILSRARSRTEKMEVPEKPGPRRV